MVLHVTMHKLRWANLHFFFFFFSYGQWRGSWNPHSWENGRGIQHSSAKVYHRKRESRSVSIEQFSNTVANVPDSRFKRFSLPVMKEMFAEIIPKKAEAIDECYAQGELYMAKNLKVRNLDHTRSRDQVDNLFYLFVSF